MKRKPTDSGDDPECSDVVHSFSRKRKPTSISLSKRKAPKPPNNDELKKGLNISALLQFSFSTSCIIPVERDEYAFERYLRAYDEYKHSFNESLWSTKSYLKAFGIHMITRPESLYFKIT